MSMWIFLQAVEPAGLPADAAGFESLFDAGFDELRARVRAGDAVWLEYGFFRLDEVYSPRSRPAAPGDLVVFGGRRVPDPAGGPGHVALDPAGVAAAAGFLRGASFPELWQAWSRLPSSDPDEDLHRRLTAEHGELRAFYGSAAERGLAVAKYVSF